MDLTFVFNIYKFLDMIQLNSQQRNVLLVIIVIIIGSLAFRVAERQRQAMAFDLKALLDGYRYSSPVINEKADTMAVSTIVKTDTSDLKGVEKKRVKSKTGKSKPAAKLKESEKININSAGIADIVRLPGIGPVLAERIIAYRDSAGPYTEAEDLLNVKGIGEKKLAKIKSHLQF